MANPEHVEIVKKGAEAIKEWRGKHPQEILDLSEANLDGLQLTPTSEYVNEFVKILVDVDLTDANLTGASLQRADLFSVDLSSAHLIGAHFYDTKLSRCNLSGTDLSKAHIIRTHFRSTLLLNACFTNSSMLGMVITDCDLSKCLGLETVRHLGPSSIDVETLVLSFGEANNRLTPEIERFLLNAGVPKQFLDALPEIVAGVKYCSCFVAYGQPDLAFAERLVKDLKARGVSCWLYSMDATPGRRVWGEITQRRREAEKMIVLCSAKSLIRDGVLKEIEEQIDEEPDKIVPISLDDTWRQNGFVIRRGHREDLKTFLLDRTYADFSDESKYNDSLNRLLKGIRRT